MTEALRRRSRIWPGIAIYDRRKHGPRPRILIVVVVPTDIEQWLAISEAEMLMRHCAYWRSLRGEPARSNFKSVTIDVERANVFNVDEVTRLMGLVAAEEKL